MKNTLKCSNNDINKFILLFRKGVYPYEYMDEWENLNETSLPEKGEIYSTLNMEDITDADYMHTKSNFMVAQCRKSCHDVVLSGLKIFLNLIKAL